MSAKVASAPEAKAADDLQLAISSGPQLRALEFSLEGKEVEKKAGQQVQMNFGLGVHRYSRTKLGVELELRVGEGEAFRLRITYRTLFVVGPETLNDARLEAEMRRISAHVAPMIMYPFIRESAATMAQKAGLKTVVPPIVNFTKVFSPESVEIPGIPTGKRGV